MQVNVLQHVEEVIARTPGTWRIELLLQTTLDNARQSISPVMATLETVDNGVLLRCYVQHLGRLAHFLVGLPFPFVVRNPPELRDELRALARKIAQIAALSADEADLE
jgi:hypothetical protein